MRGPIGRATIRTSLVLGFRLVIQAGTLLIVARLLGTHGYAEFAGFSALALMMGTLSTCGTHITLLAEVSRDPTRATDVLPYALPTTLTCGSALLIGYLSLAHWWLPGTDMAMSSALAIGLTELLLQPLITVVSSDYQARGWIAGAQTLLMTPLALRLMAAIAVYVLRPAAPLSVYSLGYLCASLLTLPVALLILPIRWPAPSRWRHPKRTELRTAFGYAALNATSKGPAELDKSLALKLLPLGAAGLYAAGARMIGALTLPVVAMMLAAMPRLFREGPHHAGSGTQLVRMIFAAAAIVSVAEAIVLWCAAPFMHVVLGPKYDGIQGALRILAFAVPAMALRIAAGNVLMTHGRPWMRVLFEAAGLATLICAATILVPRLQLTGMCMSLITSESIMAVLGWLFVTTSRPTSIGDFNARARSAQ